VTFNRELLSQTSDQNRVRVSFPIINLYLLANAEKIESTEVARNMMSIQI
jgi:hypothetical protein